MPSDAPVKVPVALWLVLVCDHHTDPEPHLFTKRQEAVDYARSRVEEYEDFDLRAEQYGDDGDELIGWTIGEEGDHVSLEPVLVDDPDDELEEVRND